MSTGRATFRNVHFYNALTGDCLGGFYQKGSLTEESMIGILTNILLIVEQPFTVKHRMSDRIITPSKDPVELGDYHISSTGPIHLNDEPWVARPITYSSSGREDQFRSVLRARDGKCVISGTSQQSNPNWTCGQHFMLGRGFATRISNIHFDAKGLLGGGGLAQIFSQDTRTDEQEVGGERS
ncbi:hypothetical protein CIHG_06224 [Coccidioides immitis H538.4]|uniref:DUF7881 domain-containing protein n=1 Tax=Coccidioides immitis H538.4 TaxID=396776 RepID=A0A0J8RWD6_COCIT|nr:hypothetical protein CIHG_06224 [Coccidioides immitis H538.4]